MVEEIKDMGEIRRLLPEGWKDICEYAFDGCKLVKHPRHFKYQCVKGGQSCIYLQEYQQVYYAPKMEIAE